MMDRFTMYPIAFVTTVQPWIAAWVLAISFFLTMALVAFLSRGRSAKEVAVLSVVGYIAMTFVISVGSALLVGVQMVEIEVVSVSPRTIQD